MFDKDKGFRDLVCAVLAQAVGDALFLRRVGSLDDKLKVTGHLPVTYRASQWPNDLMDVDEVARFFEDGRLKALINLVGLDYSPYAFKKAAMTLPVDHQIRNDWRSENKRVIKKTPLLTEAEKKKIQPKNQYKSGSWNRNNYKSSRKSYESTKASHSSTEDPRPSGDTPSSPLLDDRHGDSDN